ncbi:MAG: DUF4339 domain-containing protein [Chthoniobacterales bacterium]
MPEEWFVRVQDKDYGPVDLDTLQEWKAEGRLIPANEVRQSGTDAWLPAAQYPELFGVEPPPLPRQQQGLFRRRSFSEIISDSVRIWARGFLQFFLLALFVAIPSLAMQISFGFTNFQGGQPFSTTTIIAGAIGVSSLAMLLVCWPIFVGALQFTTVEIAAGRKPSLREALRQTTSIWPRIARLCLVVYGSFIFWTLLPLMLILSVVANPSILSFLIALLALTFQVYMAGRLFVNFMFWQQSCTIAGLDAAESLRESKDLARGRNNEPWHQRPLWRGAIIASIWLVVLVAVSVAVETPFTLVRLHGIKTLEEGIALLQQLLNAPTPDRLTTATNVVSSLVHAALRPLLGIAFVVLYFDAKSDSV